jgi:ABC-type Zn uptake system ZnuABC Zn-binding protein ZnuA
MTITARLSIVFLLTITACSSGNASSGATAQVVSAPLPGYTCFAIQNSAGETVGGNCVKD